MTCPLALFMAFASLTAAASLYFAGAVPDRYSEAVCQVCGGSVVACVLGGLASLVFLLLGA